MPGTVAGHLDRRAGDFVRHVQQSEDPEPIGLLDLARRAGTFIDAATRQDLIRLHTIEELARMGSLRLTAAAVQGGEFPGFANLAKLSMSRLVRLQRDVGLRLLGRLACCTTTGW